MTEREPEFTVWFTPDPCPTMDQQEARATRMWLIGHRPAVDWNPKPWYHGITLTELKRRMREKCWTC
jgi:hypothetical protein